MAACFPCPVPLSLPPLPPTSLFSDLSQVGCLCVDSKSLRNDLLPITAATLDKIKLLLLEKARETCIKVRPVSAAQNDSQFEFLQCPFFKHLFLSSHDCLFICSLIIIPHPCLKLLVLTHTHTCLPPSQVLEDQQQRVAQLRARPSTLDDFMDYLVMHTQQVTDKKAVMAASMQVCQCVFMSLRY